jgi:hypothetical protein
MTLQDLYHQFGNYSLYLAGYFAAVPLIAWMLGYLAYGSQRVTTWAWVFAVLVYLTCVPGVFAITLNVYLFLFERQSIWQVNLVMQFLPILSMVLTLVLIKKKIPFERIPGFDQIAGFLILITCLMGIMWVLDRLRLIAFTYIPFSYLVLGFIALLLLIRYAWSKLF